MKKKLLSILSFMLVFSLVVVPMSYAKEKEKEESTPFLSSKETQKAMDYFNKQLEKDIHVEPNKGQKLEYKYKFKDGGSQTLIVDTITTMDQEGNQDEISIASSHFAPGTAVVSKVSYTMKTEKNGSYYQQAVYGEFHYMWQTNGSMSSASHYQPPAESAGYGFTASTPQPWTDIMTNKDAAHVGSKCTFKFEAYGWPTSTNNQNAIIVLDINGNHRGVQETF